MNRVILMGRLTRDPDVRYSQGGEGSMAVARYTLAVDRRRTRSNESSNEQTADFISCVQQNSLRSIFIRELRLL